MVIERGLVATRFWSHESQLPHTPRFLLTRCWSCVATCRWGSVEAQHDQKEVTATFKLSVDFLLPSGERQLDCRALCASEFWFSGIVFVQLKEERKKWLIVEKGKERIRGVVIVYSVRNEEGKKRSERRKLLYSVYNRARWRHEARRHTNDPYPPLRAQTRRKRCESGNPFVCFGH